MTQPMQVKWSVGVDLGGTKIEAVLMRRWAANPSESSSLGFDVVRRERVPTESQRGYEAIVTATRELIANVGADAPEPTSRLSVGVGMPGSVSAGTGLVKNSNTVCLNDRPFRQDLVRALGRPIAFDNDANCFALAEATLGAAKAHTEGIVFGVIMGTGVGGGLVINGRVWDGPQHLAGEWGHHAVGPWWSPEQTEGLPEATSHALGIRPTCYCGKTGCLELYLSGTAAQQDYARRAGRQLTLPQIVDRRSTDRAAAAAIDELLEAYGRGLANLIDMLDPSAIVLGGGVSNLDFLLTEGRQRVAKYVFNDELTTPILRHALGDSAGVLGAALLPEPKSA